ncbi:SusC/RagA family TonB-linked outer membrane protein [Arundinibacter roseus]|uniref:TonB-dependent receptor n=1 Tax=Arundinibacter roseus TaxID=2070510 RepID=A0A4R4K5H0_9BACT|nr:TonB-dependent receptor [Arundinibacter roseus]TDB62734.1 TonB-dependent receptor [Arundinibacter roseus]
MEKSLEAQSLLLRIMRISIVQFVLAAVFVSLSYASDASGQELLEKRISLRLEDKSLKTIISRIESLANIHFMYSPKATQAERRTSLNVSDKPLREVLTLLLEPLQLSYRLVGTQIVLSNKKPESTSQNIANPQVSQPAPVDQTITGKVTDETGEALPGVSIVVKGSQTGTVTNERGMYSLTLSEQILNTQPTLIFSFVGYLSQEVSVTNQTTIDLVLRTDIKSLEELVVVGYGSQKKSDLTGSVVSVGEKDFTQGVNNSALQLLNGRASGVQISQSSSAPGGGIAIRIRGAGSINSSNEALIVIDGLPGASTTALSPDDIESIQILKDASAAAIYGSRAANGVVLITTKKGKKGTPQVNYSAYVGVQSVARKMDMLSTDQYVEVLNSLRADQGLAPKFTQEQINAIGPGTDWQDQIFRKALAQNHQLSLSGGSDNSNYYMGINYLNQDGVVRGSGLKKYNIRLNYQVTPSDRFKVTLNLNTNRSLTSNILTTNSGNENAGPINTALQFDPTTSAERDESGRYRFNPLISLENPLALINGVDQSNVNNRTFGTLAADYTILKGWTGTLRLGGDITNERSDRYISTQTQRGLASGGSGDISAGEELHWISEFFTTYTKTFKSIHQLSVLGGATLEEYDTRIVGANSISFLSDASLTNLLQSGDGDRGDNVSSGRSTNKLNSYLGRLNYTLKDKYLLTASVRADGTSRFSDQNKFAVFPSFALGWRLSEEPFIRQIPFFNELKLRLSFGQSGNQAIGNFETLQTFIAGGRAILGGGLVQGVEPARIPNPDLRWETTEEFDLGVDFSVLQGRISGSLEYYIKNTRDQLFNKPLPTTSGFQNIRVNFGQVRNQGLDLMLETRNTVGAFKWNTNFTFSTLKNNVVELPDFIPQILTGGVGFTSNYAIVKEGFPMRSFFGYEVEGIFQTPDQIAQSAQPNAKPGHPIFTDQNNDGKIDPNDRVILGSPFPKLMFGLSNTFAYKGFDLNVLITAVDGVSALDNNIVESLYPINFERNRLAEHYLNRWTPDNPGAQYPSGINPSSYGGALAVNSLTITDASFARLKTVALSYAVPLQGKKIRSFSVSVAADNLLTITNFLGFDPDANASGTGIERASYNSYPLNRTIRFGVNVGF